jgi:hypothetical protein
MSGFDEDSMHDCHGNISSALTETYPQPNQKPVEAMDWEEYGAYLAKKYTPHKESKDATR